jgi:hypothetical protein
LEALYVLFGDDEYVDGGFGIEVVKRKKVVVFQNGVVGNVAGDDLAKDTHDELLLIVWGYDSTSEAKIPLSVFFR